MKYTHVYTLLLMLIFHTSCGPNKTKEPKENINPIDIKSETKDVITSHGPNSITRTIEQDRSGNIWIATFQGVFQYNGNTFTNVTSKVSSDRFFSILEDKKGNLWFGSINSGVYSYDGKSFQNFTTKDGLINNFIAWIYEDKIGNIWFGSSGGASRYDGKTFLNYTLSENGMYEDKTRKLLLDTTKEVTSIIEDKAGNFWFGTRGNTFIYDGKIFTPVTHDMKPFKNVRSIIEDKKGNIWLGGNDGLWRYDGSTFTIFTQNFVGYIIEDRKGNIWTSSHGTHGWVLSRYDEKSLSHKMPTVTEINPNEGRMLFGILEANDGDIWFGGLDGVYRYDGNTITDFKSQEGRKQPTIMRWNDASGATFFDIDK